MVDFIFGGNTGIATPEDLAKRRQLVQAIKARNAGRVPKDPWEGLNAIADALGGRIEETRTNNAEAAGRSGADEQFKKFLTDAPGAVPPTDMFSNPWLSKNQTDFLKEYARRAVGGPLKP